MGNCTSYVPEPMRTAKLILLDGKLEEFSYPEKVANLLKRNPDCFICNAEEMEFDGLVGAADGEEELEPGQLYFELPLIYLRQRIQPEKMASLAVKASIALNSRSEGQRMKCGCYYRPKRVVDDPEIMMFREESVEVVKSRSPPVSGNSPGDYSDLRPVKRRIPARAAAGVGKCSKICKFTAKLTAIREAAEVEE